MIQGLRPNDMLDISVRRGQPQRIQEAAYGDHSFYGWRGTGFVPVVVSNTAYATTVLMLCLGNALRCEISPSPVISGGSVAQSWLCGLGLPDGRPNLNRMKT